MNWTSHDQRDEHGYVVLLPAAIDHVELLGRSPCKGRELVTVCGRLERRESHGSRGLGRHLSRVLRGLQRALRDLRHLAVGQVIPLTRGEAQRAPGQIAG